MNKQIINLGTVLICFLMLRPTSGCFALIARSTGAMNPQILKYFCSCVRLKFPNHILCVEFLEKKGSCFSLCVLFYSFSLKFFLRMKGKLWGKMRNILTIKNKFSELISTIPTENLKHLCYESNIFLGIEVFWSIGFLKASTGISFISVDLGPKI